MTTFCGLLGGFGLTGQNNPAAEILQPDCMEAGSASIVVYDLDRDEEIFSFDATRALPTASIQKLMTTSAVLHERGGNFRYETIIGYTGAIDNLVLRGDLVVVGSGDPTLGSGYFEDPWDIERISDTLTTYLRNKGIAAITGDIVIDVSAVPGQHVPDGWPWSDMGNYYGAGHWAFNIYDNEYKVYFRQNQTTGRSVGVLRTLPPLDSFTIHSDVRTGPAGSGDQAYIFAAPYSEAATIRGTIPPGQGSFSIRGSLPNPPLFFARELEAALHQSYVKTSGRIVVSQEPVDEVRPLFSIFSPPLHDIIAVTNFKSVNLYAEGLLKLLCGDGQSASRYECGLMTLEEFWKEKGLDDDQLFFEDGSGLSPRNTASARSFVRALELIFDDPSWYDPFVTTMPAMGEQGTLRYMLRGYQGSGRIHAKSGYIGRQRSYAGYITTESGRHLAFCVILDNYGCSSTRMRQRIERFLIGFLKL